MKDPPLSLYKQPRDRKTLCQETFQAQMRLDFAYMCSLEIIDK